MAVNLLSPANIAYKSGNGNGYAGKPIPEIVTNGFFAVDHKWTVTYWNKAAEKLLGVLAKDIVGQNLWEKFAGSIPLNFYMVYHKAFLQDIPIGFKEYWGEMGAWFDVITYHSDDTLFVSFKSSYHPAPPDQQLRILNELYRFMAEVTNDCLWEWNLDTKEMFWIDGGHKKIFGYPIENSLILQNFWENLIHPDDKIRVLKKLNKVIGERSGCLWEDKYRLQKANGEYAHVHDRGHLIYEGEKGPSRMIGATQDVTERKVAENNLLESERKLSLIARQTVNAVIITDAQGRITWINSAFTLISEYEQEEVIGKKPGSFLQGEETDPLIVQYLRQKIKEKQPFDCQIINYSKTGRKCLMHIQGQPLFKENGECEGYFAIETDITDKVLQENILVQERLTWQKEITEAVLTAQEKERAEIGKELHDNLNQILGASKLYIELAKTDDENRTFCLEKASGYIVEVIEEIRRISKTLATPGIHILGLFDSIKILLDDMVMIHPIKIDFQKRGLTDKDLDKKLQINIFRIVQEQLNNILKHAKATYATISLTRRTKEITLVISDNGEGCDLLKVKRGAGIINIRSRAELFGGRVTVASRPGQGYELKVILPLTVISK